MPTITVKMLLMGITIAAFIAFIILGAWNILRDKQQQMNDQSNNSYMPTSFVVPSAPPAQPTLEITLNVA